MGDGLSRGKTITDMGDALPSVDLGIKREAMGLCLGDMHTCVLFEDRTVKCFGKFDGIGSGEKKDIGKKKEEMGESLKAVDLGKGIKVNQLACGRIHTCARLEGGKVKCWGYNMSGALGIGIADGAVKGDEPGEMGDALPMLNLGSDLLVSNLSCFSDHCCALFENNAVKCWGYNGEGQLGLGDTLMRGTKPEDMGDNLPFVKLGKLAKVQAIKVGGGHVCALLEGGKAKCWGNNDFGQLGLGGTSKPIGISINDMGDNLPFIEY